MLKYNIIVGLYYTTNYIRNQQRLNSPVHDNYIDDYEDDGDATW
jgi:hypothetical protein